LLDGSGPSGRNPQEVTNDRHRHLCRPAQDDAAEILGRHLAVTGEDVVADRAREDADGAAMADNDCDGLA
jgi:hypothetical protein